jgi:carboxypeptidase family protein
MRRFSVCVLSILFAAVFAVSALHAQDASAVTGIVSDTNGAVIVGADVVLVNTTTRAAYSGKTNSVGSYRIVNVTPGPGYKLTFKMAGFGQVVVNDVYLTVATTRTQNATLKPGAVATEVEVSAANSEVTLNTTDATIGNNFDVKLLDELPVQGRDTPVSLFTLQPGLTTIPSMAGNPSASSVTGARTDQSYVTVDGLDVNDISSGQTFEMVARAPVDSVEEFRGTVAGQTASAGPGGGGQFQLVTKSGSNSWHGNVNLYHRDTSTVANRWFNDRDGIPLAHYVRNQFGGNVGGPIKKDKAFFFFNFYDSRIATSTSVESIVPLDGYRNGNISYVNDGNDPATGQTCDPASRLNVNPACISSINSAQVRALDPANIGWNSTVQGLLGSRYPHANDLTFGDGVNTGGYRFNSPNPDYETNYVARIDYNLNPRMRLFAKVGINRDDSVEFNQVFPSDPVFGNPFSDRSYNYVVGHTWEIGSNKVNQVYYGDTIEKFDFPANYAPTGTTVLALGGIPSLPFMGNPYNEQESQKRRLPIPMVRDDFNWQKGPHNLGFGGMFKFIRTQSRQVLDFNFLSLGLGPALPALDPSQEPADINGDPSALGLYDNAFAVGLGHISSVSTNYNYNNAGVAYANGTGHTRHYRYYQTELYFNDTWKMTRDLAVTYGMNYQYYSVPYETSGLESIENYGFDKYFAARLAQSASGVSGDSTVPFITYNLGGKANNAAPLYQPNYKDFAPHVAVAYTPPSIPGLVVNASAGMLYDRTVANALNFVQDQNSFLFQNSVETDYGDLQNDPRTGANFSFPANTSPTITKPYTPYVSGGSPYGLANSAFNVIIDPNLKDPYSIVLNGGIQQQLPWDMVLKISYAGRLGRRLLAQADASQLIDFPDMGSGQLLSAAFGSITQQARSGQAVATPQPWFEDQVFPGATKALYKSSSFRSYIRKGDFADFVQLLSYFGLIDTNVGMASQFSQNTFYTNKGASSYHGLLTTLSKNMSNGLQFTVNYTWSHSMDNTSLIANVIGSNSGVGLLCDALHPRACRGNSDFDQTHVINGDFSYQLPIGRGKSFGATLPRWANEAVGGWTVAGIPSWHSGLAFTAFSNAFLAGFATNDPGIFNGNRGAVTPHLHKTSSGAVTLFANPATANASFAGPVGFQYGSRNNLRGPSAWGMDAGLGKSFAAGERTSVKFRADAFNVFNHPTFALPSGTDISGSSGIPFAQINETTGAPRVVQLALRIEF